MEVKPKVKESYPKAKVALWVYTGGIESMIGGIGQLVGIVGGVAVLGGITIAVIGKEIVEEDKTLIDKAEDGLIKLGFVTEGMVKGAIISVPVCAVVLIGLNVTMKAQKSLVGGI